MNIQRATPVNELLAKLIFLMLPTAAISFFLLIRVNEHCSILQNQAFMQCVYLSAGMGIAAVLYSLRIRFLPTYLILIAVLCAVYKGLDNTASSEFDSFFIARRFQIIAILFCFGWLIGWGYIRLRYFAVIISVSLLSACIAYIATANVEKVMTLLLSFLPALVYAIYNIFTAEQIYNYKDKTGKFWWYLTRRLILFALLVAPIMAAVVYYLKDDIKAVVAEYGGGGKKGKSSMTKENADHTVDLSQYSKLSSSLDRSTTLLFCAHINNFFPNTDIPNPLYLTAFYFTKFDTSTETFERDSVIPFNDLFEPDPSKIPLFSTRTDSSVIRNSLGAKLRQTVEVEVYSKELSPTVYLAPNVGYFVQPITVEKDFRAEFKSAFRAKSYTSVLNSAYFVYNTQDSTIRKFQEMRFSVLRTVPDYNGVDARFMKYYTYMPASDKFTPISAMAHKITDTAHTPVDKILAIRNYFYSKDENGDRLYSYTDNPGVPDIPNASKLLYFLTENHKGYCAYYAGATLFMLRSLGIPSRIAVGFLTEERSDKNKGWYWYYANQAHAWVQVYFPGYGWLDFDTTVGNDDENRPTPQPDGTPPMQPPKAWLAADGMIENVDTLRKTIQMSVKQMVFHDKEYKLSAPVEVNMDMKVAVIYRDSLAIPLQKLQKGDEGTAISYADVLKKIEPSATDDGAAIISRFPVLTPIDEVYLKNKLQAQAKEKQAQQEQEHPVPVRKILLTILLIAGILLVIFVRLPRWVLYYFILRHNNARPEGDKPYWAYRTATYFLHMAGMFRGNKTPMQYARTVVDPALGSSFTGFMNIYLKLKYAKQPLTPAEQQKAATFLKPFLQQARRGIPFKKKFLGFLNPIRTIGFFVMPEDEEEG